jgi:hypothetical protein
VEDLVKALTKSQIVLRDALSPGFDEHDDPTCTASVYTGYPRHRRISKKRLGEPL